MLSFWYFSFKTDSFQAYSTDPAVQAQIFMTYINWETDLKAKNSKQASEKHPTADPTLIRCIFERSLTAYARAASTSELGVQVAEASLKAAEDALSQKPKGKKGKGRVREQEQDAEQVAAVALRQDERRTAVELVRSYKEAEARIWTKYAVWLVSKSRRFSY